SSRSGSRRASDSVRRRARAGLSRATRRCTQSAKGRSVGSPKAMPSVNANSSTPSSASPRKFLRRGVLRSSPLLPYLQHNPFPKMENIKGETSMSAKRNKESQKGAAEVPQFFRLNLEVGDLPSAISFYSKLLGIEGRKQAGSRCYFECGPVTLQ